MRYSERFPPIQGVEDPIVIENILYGRPIMRKNGKQYVARQPHVTYVADKPDVPLVDQISFSEIAERHGFHKGRASRGFGLLAQRKLIDNAAPEVQQTWFGDAAEYPGQSGIEFEEIPIPGKHPIQRDFDYLSVPSLAAAIEPVVELLAEKSEDDADERLRIVRAHFGKSTFPVHISIYETIVNEVLS